MANNKLWCPGNDKSFCGHVISSHQKYLLLVTGGPGFLNKQTLFGIKTSSGFYFFKSQKWTSKISYLNIFNREKITKEDFDFLTLAIGLKSFWPVHQIWDNITSTMKRKYKITAVILGILSLTYVVACTSFPFFPDKSKCMSDSDCLTKTHWKQMDGFNNIHQTL